MRAKLGRKKSYLLTLSFLALVAGSAAFPFISLNSWAKSGKAGLEVEVPPPDFAKAEQVSSLSERITRIQDVGQNLKNPLDQARTRFLLANAYLEQKNSTAAQNALEGLKHPVLEGWILAKQAEALRQQGNKAQALAKWQQVLTEASGSFPVAEALYQRGLLGNSASWNELLESYPKHSRTADVLRVRLGAKPDDVTALSQFVRNFADEPDSLTFARQREKLGALTAEDEQGLGMIYLHQKLYREAAQALSSAPATAENLMALGTALKEIRDPSAASAFDRVVSLAPRSEEAVDALFEKAELLRGDTGRQVYGQIAQQYPAHAAEAMIALAKMGNKAERLQGYQQVLASYSSSAETAEAAWELAWDKAKQGDTQGAYAIASKTVDTIPDQYRYSPMAMFWAGRWAQQLGDEGAAKKAWKEVLKRHPNTYYAWRAAVHLGLDVGSFYNRQLPYVHGIDQTRPPAVLAGSGVVKELYGLGLEQEASMQWKSEMYLVTPEKMTAPQQATDAVFTGQSGHHLAAIKRLNLINRNLKDAQVLELRKDPAFWQAVYPLHYWKSVDQWSAANGVNPLMVQGLIRQESGFDADIRSRVGAVGLMQVMPGTGQSIARSLGVSSQGLADPETNIRFGTWYLASTHRRWQDNSLLAVASYNAGPGNVAKWTGSSTLADPEAFIETIPFQETRGYVKSVFGNYWNYLRLYSPDIASRVRSLEK
jgi:soluble lytic murein transglycosylase